MGLSEFLEHYKTNDSKNVTHTPIGGGGRWAIPSKDYKLFYKLIRKAHKKGEVVPPLTEKMGPYHPLVFDFDMKYKDDIQERPYDVTFLKHLCEFLWVCIGEVIDIDDEK